MYSHIVIFWVDSGVENGMEKLINGIKQYLKPIPEIVFFHVGVMAPSPRPVVDQTYQVGLNVVFKTKEAHDNYQEHPLHLEFLEKTFKPLGCRVKVYDFQS